MNINNTESMRSGSGHHALPNPLEDYSISIGKTSVGSDWSDKDVTVLSSMNPTHTMNLIEKIWDFFLKIIGFSSSYSNVVKAIEEVSPMVFSGRRAIK